MSLTILLGSLTTQRAAARHYASMVQRRTAKHIGAQGDFGSEKKDIHRAAAPATKRRRGYVNRPMPTKPAARRGIATRRR